MNVNKPANPFLRASLLAALLLGTASVATAAPSNASASAATTTINFENIPVRSALQLIAEQGDFNLIVSDSVQGNITLHLRDVTWEQAFDIVLRMKGLGKRIDATGSVTVSRG
jgi:type IV pilus assembly protein PilQ